MSDNVIRPDHPAWIENGKRSLIEPVQTSMPVEGGGGGPHDPGVEARVTALEAGIKDVDATLSRIEPKLERVDDRLRSVEIAVANMDGKLDLLVAKMPSWWQQPVGVAATVALLAAAIALAKAAGLLH